MTCRACGFDNLPNARFCSGCGAELSGTRREETRKTVSVVFCDLTGSTALGEHNDPETMREVVTRYFDRMRAVVERHGGSVEKFIGDAVMALFGVPVVNEDDAIRAARAGFDMLLALDKLNAELDTDFGIHLQARVGVNTGEVIVGEETGGRGSVVTGDAVNVAARLQTAAAPGEVLLGQATYLLAREYVDAQPVGPLSLKGKEATVDAWRLLGYRDPAAAARRAPAGMIAPLVGRDRELGLLETLLDRCSAEQTCQLVTMLGVAGIGKSRLMQDFTEAAGRRATVLRGRCLPYGDGVALWPLVEAVRSQLADRTVPERAIRALSELFAGDPDADQLAERLAGLGGVGETPPPALSDVQWAVRRWLETLGRRSPVVLVIDDVHWADESLLGVVDQVADWACNAAILLVCLARPEFLDGHPQWGGGKVNSTNVLLQPLDAAATAAMLDHVLADARPAFRERLMSAADGNPLFLEQLLAMLADDGTLVEAGGHWEITREVEDLAVPPTIGALLSARLDRLQEAERTALEAAAVVGQVFYLGSVVDLVDGATHEHVGGILQSLVRKQLIRPESSDLPGEATFRFQHMLVRDAAYRSVPKRRRAELHERFARWLDKRQAAAGSPDVAEFVAYHLEQAVLLLRAISPSPRPEVDELADEAIHRLSEAAAEWADNDPGAAVALLDRAAALAVRDPHRRMELSLRATAAIPEPEVERTQARATALVAEAAAAGLPELSLRARMLEIRASLGSDPSADVGRALAEVRAAADRFRAAGDHAGAAQAHTTLATIAHLGAHWHEMLAEIGMAKVAAERAGDVVLLHVCERMARAALTWGPIPVPDALERLGPRPGGHEPLGRQLVWFATRGVLCAYDDRAGECWEHFDHARRIADELHNSIFDVAIGFFAATAGDALGDLERFLPAVERGVQVLETWHDAATLSTLLPLRARYRLAAGRREEARADALRARDLTNAADSMSQAAWRMVLGECEALAGEPAAAGRLLDEAVAWIHRSDQLNEQALVHEAYARAGRYLGDGDLARRETARALELYCAKGNRAAVRRLSGGGLEPA